MAEFDEDELIQLSLLRDEEIDALVESNFMSSDDVLSLSLDKGFGFSTDEFILKIRTGATYPLCTVQYSVENRSYPQNYADVLLSELDSIVKAGAEKNTLERWLKREEDGAYGIFEPHRTVFELVTSARSHLDCYHGRLLKGGVPITQHSRKNDKHSWFMKDAKQAVVATNLQSVNEVAHELLRCSPKQISDSIQAGAYSFRVLHVEQILRLDLSERHEVFRSNLRSSLQHCSMTELRKFVPPGSSSRLEDMLDHLTKSRITFHGTKRQFVPSIVRHAFVAAGKHNPTTGQKNGVRCGSTYGRGVYSSPDASYALSYSGEGGGRTSAKEFYGVKLVVCATIMGRSRRMTRDDDWHEKEAAHETADSHIGNNELEYIVFGKAQSIPVYVIHLDWGHRNVEFFSKIPSNRSEWRPATSSADTQRKQEDETMYPGDKQRAKEATFAKAAKYFPYGFGPATGSKFVVEEVGEISDDEEEYGEYQALRVDEDESGEASTEFWSWVKVGAEEEHRTLFQGTHAADKYMHHRHALGVPGGFKRKASEWDELGRPGEKAEVKDEDVFGLVSMMNELPESD